MYKLGITMILATLSVPVVSAPVAACEHHAHAELKPETPALPSSSIYHLDSRWISAGGEKLELHHLKGKPRVVAMLFTACATACPMIIQDMKEIHAKVPERVRQNLVMTVFSFDAKRDTPKALVNFSKKMNLDTKSWLLLTPAKATSVPELAAALNVQYKQLPSGDFIHSNVMFLLNENGEVVAKKEGLKTPAAAFIKDIEGLASNRIKKTLAESN